MHASNLREHNAAAILLAAVRGGGSLSRADIAGQLGLTRSTVSVIVEELLAAGLLSESAPAPSGGGRPKIPLWATDAVVGLGVEIAADRVRVVARSLGGRTMAVAEEFSDVTRREPADVVRTLDDLVGAIREHLPTSSDPVGLTVSVPGRLSGDGRTVISAPNLGWADVPLGDLLAARPALAALTPRIANDADLAARHEATSRYGESFVFVHGETGIGGAIVLNGSIFRGDHGWAGEIGHVNVVPDGALCGCGRHGCLEAYAGFHALRQALDLPVGTHIDEVAAALAIDDPASRALVDEVGGHLGEVIAAVLNVLDLSTVVLSGYFRTLAPQLAPAMHRVLDQRALRPGAQIVPATGEGRHEADGAAREALEGFWGDVTGWMARRDRA